MIEVHQLKHVQVSDLFLVDSGPAVERGLFEARDGVVGASNRRGQGEGGEQQFSEHFLLFQFLEQLQLTKTN